MSALYDTYNQQIYQQLSAIKTTYENALSTVADIVNELSQQECELALKKAEIAQQLQLEKSNGKRITNDEREHMILVNDEVQQLVKAVNATKRQLERAKIRVQTVEMQYKITHDQVRLMTYTPGIPNS
jgi:HAMP domain-containing protein